MVDNCMWKVRCYENDDFADYVATLEKTTSWGKEAENELKGMLTKVSREQIWVVDIDGKAVGFMILTENDDGSLEIDWLDVHPDFQRRSIGSALVKKACRIAKEKKKPSLSIHTSVNNEKMIKFSIKNGFEVVEQLKDFYGSQKDALRLKKI